MLIIGAYNSAFIKARTCIFENAYLSLQRIYPEYSLGTLMLIFIIGLSINAVQKVNYLSFPDECLTPIPAKYVLTPTYGLITVLVCFTGDHT